jgi:adenylylsulfate kinase-like enzyme
LLDPSCVVPLVQCGQHSWGAADRTNHRNYKKARAGEIRELTGISAPYEPPLHPEIVVRTNRESEADSLAKILSYLVEKGYIPRER